MCWGLLQLWKKGRCVFPNTGVCSFSGTASAPCDGQISTGAVSRGLWHVPLCTFINFCCSYIPSPVVCLSWIHNLFPVHVFNITGIVWGSLHYTALQYNTLHCTALHCTTLHCTTLHCTTLHYTTLYYTTLYYTALHYTALYYTTLYYTALHYTALHYTALHYTVLHYTALHYTALHYTVLHYTALHYTTLHYTALHCTTLLHYTTLHCTTLHCTTLHCTTLHYTTLHCTTLCYTTLHNTPLLLCHTCLQYELVEMMHRFCLFLHIIHSQWTHLYPVMHLSFCLILMFKVSSLSLLVQTFHRGGNCNVQGLSCMEDG